MKQNTEILIAQLRIQGFDISVEPGNLPHTLLFNGRLINEEVCAKLMQQLLQVEQKRNYVLSRLKIREFSTMEENLEAALPLLQNAYDTALAAGLKESNYDLLCVIGDALDGCNQALEMMETQEQEEELTCKQ